MRPGFWCFYSLDLLIVSTEQHRERTALVQKPLTANPERLVVNMLNAMMSAKRTITTQIIARKTLSRAPAAMIKRTQRPLRIASITQMRNVARTNVPKLSICTYGWKKLEAIQRIKQVIMKFKIRLIIFTP